MTTTPPLKIMSEPYLLMEKNAPILLNTMEYKKVSVLHVLPGAIVHCIWGQLLTPGCMSQEPLPMASSGLPTSVRVAGWTQSVTSPSKLYPHLQMRLARTPRNWDEDTLCSERSCSRTHGSLSQPTLPHPGAHDISPKEALPVVFMRIWGRRPRCIM